MSSYQKRKQEIESLRGEVNELKKELYSKGSVFFKEVKFLGVNRSVYGVIVNGTLEKIHEEFHLTRSQGK